MATVLDRVPVDEVRAEARDVKFLVTVLTVLTGVLFVVGWLAGAVWAAVAWSMAAVKVGFRQGRRVGASSDGVG